MIEYDFVAKLLKQHDGDLSLLLKDLTNSIQILKENVSSLEEDNRKLHARLSLLERSYGRYDL